MKLEMPVDGEDPAGAPPMSAAAPLRVLLVGLQRRNFAAGRFSKALGAAGFHVAGLGHKDCVLHRSRHLDARLTLPASRSERRLRRSVERAYVDVSPDIIIPCDEPAVSLVNYWLGTGGRHLSGPLLACLERSLGPSARVPMRASKLQALALARSIGVRCPRERPVRAFSDCERAAAEFGYPVVLKTARGAGGQGVRICRTPQQLRAAFELFDRHPSKLKLMRRRILGRRWLSSPLEILIQEYVAGTPAMTCASALAGRTLAVVCGTAGAVQSETGQASIVRLAHHPEMATTTAKMIAAFEASGFVSFDFVIDAEGRAVLIECNPRPTQILPLGPLSGVDLAQALAEALRAPVLPSEPSLPTGEARVAFFPNEWRRDPASPALRTAIHDVPWDDPELVKAMLA